MGRKGRVNVHCCRGEGAQGGGTQNCHDLLRDLAMNFQFDYAVFRQPANRVFKPGSKLCSVHVPGMQIDLNHGPGGQFVKPPLDQPAGVQASCFKLQDQIPFFLIFFGKGCAIDGAWIKYRGVQRFSVKVLCQDLEAVNMA